VFYLPSYSPELNPDERLNADLKHAIGTKLPARTRPKLRAAAEQHMQFMRPTRSAFGPTSKTPIDDQHDPASHSKRFANGFHLLLARNLTLRPSS